MRTLRLLAGSLLIAAALAACSQSPQVPVDDETMFSALTAESGQEFLREVSEHDWEDNGEGVGARLRWIGEDAGSADEEKAQRAGDAARAIATFLAENADSLREVPTGVFGLQRNPVGEVNPALVEAYASALIPFQGALVGDFDGVRGFESVGGPRDGDLASARNVFAVIDTDTEAGNAFTAAANQRVRQYLQTYGQAVAAASTVDPVALRHAAELAGVVEGGQHASGNSSIETNSAQYWINWAAYEVAAASSVQPGDPDIPTQFFSAGGRLLRPDEVPPNKLDSFATAFENFAFHHGAQTMGTDFDGWYEDAAGK